jgi:hypothetical protein
VNIRFKQVVVRGAVASGLLVGLAAVGCSSTTDPASGGTSGTATMSTSGASAGGSGGTGGAAAGTSSSGSGGGGGAAGKCSDGKVMVMGACACPPYAPLFCEAVPKCVTPTKDPDHCGDCATKCNAMSACAASKCTPDLTTFGEVAGCGSLKLLSTADKLYVLSTMTGALTSFALPAGGAAVPIATGLTGGTAFAVDATNAYVATGMTVTQVKLAGGAKTVLVTEATPIFDVAVDAGKIYYAVGKDIKQADAAAPSTGVSVAVSADEGMAQGVAVSGGMVLYASNEAFNLEADPIVGEGHVKIGASQSALIFGHRSVQADATSVFWVQQGVQRAAFGGADHAGKTVAVPLNSAQVIAYAVDSAAKTVYIATDDGSLEKSTYMDGMDTAEAAWVARALPKVSSVVLDATSVYVASECKILKSAR